MGALLFGLLFLTPLAAAAEWHIKPFLGVTWGGSTTFVDFEQAVGTLNPAIGASAGWLGEVIGLEADVGHLPGFFQTGDNELVQRSRVTTMTGNVVLALPRRLSEYTLRPYVVGGGGAMRVRIDDRGDLPAASTIAALDVVGEGRSESAGDGLAHLFVEDVRQGERNDDLFVADDGHDAQALDGGNHRAGRHKRHHQHSPNPAIHQSPRLNIETPTPYSRARMIAAPGRSSVPARDRFPRYSRTAARPS